VASLYSAQQAKVLAQRGKVAEAQRLSADVRVLRDQYAKTSARAVELQQQGEADETGLTLLGNATTPASPVFPKWPLVIFASLAGGLALGLILSLAIELFGRRVRGVEDLRIGDVPVLGTMARPAAARRRGLAGLFGRFLPLRRPAVQGY
jgi:capsular polysaccharide biosynthesis protein